VGDDSEGAGAGENARGGGGEGADTEQLGQDVGEPSGFNAAELGDGRRDVVIPGGWTD
jgi:hypothetical protein